MEGDDIFMNAIIDLSHTYLETDRLLLRSWNENDVDDFFAYASVEGVGEAAGWKHHESKEESQMILNMFIQEKKTLAIVCKEDKKVIGSIGLEECRTDLDSSFDYLKGREIGYVLNRDYWNKGIMSEAVSCVIDYCFQELKLDFLCCGYFVENIRSKRVNEKMGFQYYKNVIHHTRYGVDKDTVLTVMFHNR